MEYLTHYFQLHGTAIIITCIAQQLFSAVVQSLPKPTEYGGIWYKSIYNFLTILAADFKSFTTQFAPMEKTREATILPSGAVNVAETTVRGTAS